MRGYLRFLVPAVAVTAVVALGISPPSAAAVTVTHAKTSSPAGGPLRFGGRSAPLPRTPPQPKNLATMGLGTGSGLSAADATALAAATRQARASGRPVTVNALTTGTSTVAAQPGGGLSLTEYLLPVRVRRGSGWVPVSTALSKNADGTLSPAAVPGDTVTFSGGGSGPAATVSAAGTSLSLSWPGALPAPAVSGDSATYRNMLPGVDLVLTAVSDHAGGFSQTLVIHTGAAARDPALAQLSLPVQAKGVRLAAAPGGGVTASAPGVAGTYTMAPALMWDSSSVSLSASDTVRAAAAGGARAAGAQLAPPGLAGPVSSAAGPAAGARLAPVGTAAAGGRLRLTPDRALLASGSTRFPVFIDPTTVWLTADGGRQAYDETQSACPTASHYNPTDPNYWSLGLGYDGWGDDCNGNNGYARADYQVAVPSAIWGAHLKSATVKAQEAYTASCSALANVTLSWTGGINSGTDWNNDPKVIADQATVDVGPNTTKVNGSYVNCDTSYDTDPSTFVGVDFDVMNAMSKAAAQHWKAFAFRLSEPGNSNRDDWKRFGKNPYLQLIYNDTPDVPGSEKATADSDGAGSAGCDTTGSSPQSIGAESGSGPYLWARYSDPDKDSVQGETRYWKYPQQSATANTPLKTASDLPAGGATVAEAIPSGFYSGLTDGQVIAWDADATDGTYTSGWSATCYFAAWPTAPHAPALSAPAPGSDCPGSVITAGCQVTFTITAASGDPATEFVWRLDNYPATASPPADEILAASGSPPSATLTITVPTPGPHNLWVYASDKGANDSGDTNGATSGDTTFIAAGDAAVSCPSFADALGNSCSGGGSSPNTMISKASGSPLSCGATAGDGGGRGFDATDLANAGWRAGGTITIDGASFGLPGFGSCQPDNVLAANQTIGMGGAQGSSLVFLAASSYAFAGTTGLTGAQDSGVLEPDATVPGVPGRIAVTGGGCGYAVQNDTNVAGCNPATGTVNYASGCPETSSTYYLTVPDWWSGPADIAAVTLPHVDETTGQISQTAKLYAFAARVVPGCQIASVTLPDVGSTVDVQLNSGSSSASYNPPALHIFGMSVRNTTTATPQAGGGSVGAPSAQSWTGAWAAPIENAAGPPSGKWGNRTLRIQTSAPVSGSDVRIRLSDPGFLSGDGDAPLQVGHATIAVSSGGAVPAAAPQTLSFGAVGSQSVMIPKGGDIYSNPLGFTVSAGQTLLVSLYLANAPGSLAYLPGHGWASTVQWVTAPVAQGSSGDYTTDTTGTPFGATGSFWTVNTDILTGVDVSTAQTTTDPGGTPTVSVLGDNLIDVNYSGLSTRAISIPITRVDGGLASAEAGSFGVVGDGVNSNQASADSTAAAGGGVSAVARLDRDVLAEPGIGTVIIDEGLQDVLHGAGEQQLEDAYGAMINELNAFGVNVFIATITPCSGYSSSAAGDSCSSAVDGIRTDVNDNFIENLTSPGSPQNCYADFDAAVSNGASPGALQSADDAGDHANLTQAGYTALTSAVGSQGCPLAANVNPPPP